MRLFATIVLVWSLLGILVVRFSPVGSQQPEWLWIVAFGPVFPLFGILAVAAYIKFTNNSLANKMLIGSLGFSTILCLSVLATFMHNREQFIGKLRLQIQGSVVKKYRSRNHAAPSLRIQTVSGEMIELDGVTLGAWESTSVGDSINKEAWSDCAMIESRKMQFFTW